MTGIPLNIDIHQILLHLFNFTFLFGALYILLYKPVRNYMAGRDQYYTEMDKRKTGELKAAEDSRQKYDDRLRALDDEVRAERNRVGKELSDMRDRQITDAREEAERIVKDAKAEAARQKDEIIASAQKEIADIVTDAMEKLTLEQSASDAFDQFLDAAEAQGERG